MQSSSKKMRRRGVIVKPSDFTKQLIDAFEQKGEGGRLLAEQKLLAYLSRVVPSCYKVVRDDHPLSGIQPYIDLGNLGPATQIIFPSLDDFLNQEKEFAEHFKRLSASSSDCGHEFKAEESVYTCLDCGIDQVFGLCSECFQHSAHKSHRYKELMSSATGDTVCDCGNEEAWKQDAHCYKHKPRTENAKTVAFPEKLRKRIHFLFSTLLRYCFDVLLVPFNFKGFGCFSDVADGKSKDETYCVAIYSDKSCSTPAILSVLQNVLDCSDDEACWFIKLTELEGRSIVYIDGDLKCRAVEEELVLTIREDIDDSSDSLRLRVTQESGTAIGHQVFATKMLKWMTELCRKGYCFRELLADVCDEIKLSEDGKWNLLNGIIMNETMGWKLARKGWHQLMMAGMMRDFELKKRFAVTILESHLHFVECIAYEDVEYAFSILSIVAKIFTIPQIAHYLIEKHDFLFKLADKLVTECQQHVKNKTLDLSGRKSHAFIKTSRVILLHVKYILSRPPPLWTSQLEENFLRGMKTFFVFLNYLQEIHPVTRGNVAEKVENDSGIEPAAPQDVTSVFMVQRQLEPVLPLLLQWLETNPTVLRETFKMCHLQLKTKYKKKMAKLQEQVDNPRVMIYYRYDVATKPVSFYLPLSRLFASLFPLLGISPECGDTPAADIFIMEPALRVQVLVAQVHAGMWKQKGAAPSSSPLYTICTYEYQYFKNSQVRDKDILSLQVAASLMDPSRFLNHLISTFNLFQWTDAGFYDNFLSKIFEEDKYHYIIFLGNSLLDLVMTIFSARFVPDVGQVTKDECAKKEIVQLLCWRSVTRSKLITAVVGNGDEEPGLEAVISQTTSFKMGPGTAALEVYELKPEFYEEYDWHYWHYSPKEMIEAESMQRERKKKAGQPVFFPPPKLPRFKPKFEPAVNILTSNVMLKLVSTLLQRCVTRQSKHHESHLKRVLHLIGYGLNEEIAKNEESRGEHSFHFREACERWGIFELVDLCLEKEALSQHHDMILWIQMQKRNSTLPIRLPAAVPTTVALGPLQTPVVNEEDIYVCEICKQEHILNLQSDKVLYSPVFLQPSPVMCEKRDVLGAEKVDLVGVTHKPDIWIRRNQKYSLQVSSCGHVMHSSCWLAHEKGCKQTQESTSESGSLGVHESFQKAGLCPSCDFPFNIVVPVALPLHKLHPPASKYSLPREYLGTAIPSWVKYPFKKEDDNDLRFRVWLTALRKRKLVEDSEDKWGYVQSPVFVRELIALIHQDKLRGELLLESFPGHLYQEQTVGWLRANFFEKLQTFMGRASKLSRLPEHQTSIYHCLAYTIASSEESCRAKSMPFFGPDVPPGDALALKLLARAASVSLDPHMSIRKCTHPGPFVLEVLQGLFFGVLDSIWHAKEDAPCMMEFDAFGLLTHLTYLMPYALCKLTPPPSDEDDVSVWIQCPLDPGCVGLLPPIGSFSDHHNVRLAYTIHVYQIIINTDNIADFMSSHDDNCDCITVSLPAPDSYDKLFNGAKHLNWVVLRVFLFEMWLKSRQCPHFDRRFALFGTLFHLDIGKMWENCQERSMPFLRCCAKLYECMTGIPPPEKACPTFDDLTSYLDLPKDLLGIFCAPEILQMAMRWSAHPSMPVAVLPVKARDCKDPRLNNLYTFDIPRNFRPHFKHDADA